MPKTAAGVNFLNISPWNKTALCKLLWNLSHKNDKLWIMGSHILCKGRNSMVGQYKTSILAYQENLQSYGVRGCCWLHRRSIPKIALFLCKKKCTNWCKECFQ
ncbi:hypothetical protein RDI58_001623 [Solanum bulbocastanum]|uniref:Uncharacterized protein n=1 Tax=Solanum bulbocastanum TaxID=147425 RepID=A0AAN8U5F7_SOLBU